MSDRADLTENQRRIADALKPFGWTCSPEFWRRYYSDTWVFNLVNAVVRLTEPAHVCQGWWHPNVRSGQVHDHPEHPGRSWQTAMHRQCEQIYTKRAIHTDRPEATP
jgi:hypothetical protein